MVCSFWRAFAAIYLLTMVLGVTACDKGAEKTGDAPQSAQPAPAAAPSVAPAATPPAAVAGTATKEVWPTEEEAKAAIFKLEYSIRANDTQKATWHVKDMRHEVKSVKFAERTTQKQMNFGARAVTVYPAKILYTRITEYTDKPTKSEEEGGDGVWFFYKDSFGEWKCKYGNE